jgi:hypothetical protein
VFIISIWLIMFMTTDAREVLVIAEARMTLAAGGPFVSVFARVDPEELHVMIECRGVPHCCRVALLALVTELQRHVVWIGRERVVVLMALIAIDVHKIVVAVDMA